MTSHEYANRLREIGDFLLSKPEFDTGGTPHVFLSFYDKDEFLSAVKALGAGTKEFTTGSWRAAVEWWGD